MKILILIGATVLLFYVFRPSLENREDYKAGYNAGYEEGLEDQKSRMCEKIEERLNSGARDAVCN